MLRLLALLLVSFVLCSDVDEKDVVVLTKDNFEDILGNNDLVLVEFYAPWCGHCKKLTPEYARAATSLKEAGDQVVLAKVDATIETELAERFDIGGFPTLKLFRNKQPSEYDGGRTSGDIISYLRRQSGPAVKELNDHGSFEKFTPDSKEDGAPVLVAFTSKGSDLDKFYNEFANKHRNDYTFGAVRHNDVIKQAGRDQDTIALFKHFDDKLNVYSAGHDHDELLKFLSHNSFPLVDEIGPENYKSYVDRGLPILWLFVDPSNADDVNEAIEALKQVAPKFRELSFVHLNGVQYKQMAQKMALTGDALPGVAIETKKGEHFAYPEGKKITAEDLEQWLKTWNEGTLDASIRSSPIPDEPLEEGVRVVVGKNFKEVVLDTNKDVLIEFYAPWCGHCKKLAPIYSELAADVADVSTLVIAKMDSTTNDPTSDFQVQGFPTIKFVRGGDNKIIDYDGARTKEGFLEFLKANAHTKFEK